MTAIFSVNFTSACKKCGIYPYDRYIFTEVDFIFPVQLLAQNDPYRPAPDIDDRYEEEPTHRIVQYLYQNHPKRSHTLLANALAHRMSEDTLKLKQERTQGRKSEKYDCHWHSRETKILNKRQKALAKQNKTKYMKRRIVDEEGKSSKNQNREQPEEKLERMEMNQ